MKANDYISITFANEIKTVCGKITDLINWLNENYWKPYTDEIEVKEILSFEITTSSCYNPKTKEYLSCLEIKLNTITNTDKKYDIYVNSVKTFTYLPEEY